MEQLASDVRRVFGREEDDGSGDIVRCPCATKRGASDQSFSALGRHAVAKELGPLDVAWDDRVHSNAIGAQPQREVERPPQDRRFGRLTGSPETGPPDVRLTRPERAGGESREEDEAHARAGDPEAS